MIKSYLVLKQSLLLAAWPLATPFVSISACSANKKIQNLLIIFPIEIVKYHEMHKMLRLLGGPPEKASFLVERKTGYRV